jgi:hypothetical protein
MHCPFVSNQFLEKKRPCVNGRLVGHKEQVERGYKYKWVLLGIVTPIFANAPQKKKIYYQTNVMYFCEISRLKQRDIYKFWQTCKT